MCVHILAWCSLSVLVVTKQWQHHCPCQPVSSAPLPACAGHRRAGKNSDQGTLLHTLCLWVQVVVMSPASCALLEACLAAAGGKVRWHSSKARLHTSACCSRVAQGGRHARDWGFCRGPTLTLVVVYLFRCHAGPPQVGPCLGMSAREALMQLFSPTQPSVGRCEMPSLTCMLDA